MIVIVSCEQETQYRYYESGSIAEKKVFFQKGDTSSYILTEYYTNKQVKMQGKVVNSLREGVWQKWYADGDLLWKVKYIEGWRQPPDSLGNPKYLFSDSLIVGKPIYLRVSLEGIYREDLLVLFSNLSTLIAADNLDMYDFVIVPQKSGYMGITVAALKMGATKGTVELVEMRDSFYVYPNTNYVLLE